MNEIMELHGKYEKAVEEEEKFNELKEKYGFYFWMIKTIFVRFILMLIVLTPTILVHVGLYISLSLIGEIISTIVLLNQTITPVGYDSSLRGLYEYSKDNKKNGPIGQFKLFLKLKKQKESRKTFIEFYDRLLNDKEFRNDYLNALKD